MGTKTIIKMLLDAGADVNGGKYGTVLGAAAACGLELQVKMLLDAGADVNSRGWGVNMPLPWRQPGTTRR